MLYSDVAITFAVLANLLHGVLGAGWKMNSLNIISSRVSPSTSPAPSRTSSLGTLSLALKQAATGKEHDGDNAPRVSDTDTLVAEPDDGFPVENPGSDEDEKHGVDLDEYTPLLARAGTGYKDAESGSRGWHTIPKRIATSFINTIRLVLSALAAPGVYLISCLYGDDGNFAPLLLLRTSFGGRRKAAKYEATVDEKPSNMTAPATSSSGGRNPSTARYSTYSSSGLSSESESDRDASTDPATGSKSSAGRAHARSKSLQASEEIAPSRRSIRIKLHSDADSSRQRKHKKSQSSTSPRPSADGGGTLSRADISAQLKSPTSPAGALTRYPRTPAPPRPLIPRRQPSYVNLEPGEARHHLKTLVLDLDETLIHSMSKGGRMSTGHMVEVRLNTTYAGVGGQASVGPQHPILYYVHKRPHCDDFLRRVSFPLLFPSVVGVVLTRTGVQVV